MMFLRKVSQLLPGLTLSRLSAAHQTPSRPGGVSKEAAAAVVRGLRIACARMLSQGRAAGSDLDSDKPRPRKPITISIEGNIGAGKTTLMEFCARDPEVTAVEEPVQRWRNAGGHNLFDLMYADPSRWSFAFQSYVQLTMLENHLRPAPTPVKLMERSVFSARYCFVENMRLSKVMSDAEVTVLDSLFQFLVAHHDIAVDRVIYLRTSPEDCQERIRRRCRTEEEGIPLDYLQGLHQHYEDWLIGRKFPMPGSVVVLDGSVPLEEMLAMYQKKKDSILCRGWP